MPIISPTKFLRGLFNRDAELAALDKDIAATASLADPGERLLGYDRLTSRGKDILNEVVGKFKVPAVFSLFCGVAMGVAAFTAGLPLLGVAGVAVFAGTLYTVRRLGGEALDAAWRRIDTCGAASKEIAEGTELRRFAASPHFGEVMSNYPAIRDKFILAAAREKLLQPAAPAAAPARPPLPIA